MNSILNHDKMKLTTIKILKEKMNLYGDKFYLKKGGWGRLFIFQRMGKTVKKIWVKAKSLDATIWVPAKGHRKKLSRH